MPGVDKLLVELKVQENENEKNVLGAYIRRLINEIEGRRNEDIEKCRSTLIERNLCTY